MIVIVGVWRFSGIIQTHKIIDVDRQHISSNAERQDEMQSISGGDNDLQEFIHNSDLIISNQDTIQVQV